MKPIVVVGSINMDLVCRAPHIPRPGETVLGTDFQMHAGGKGANQAVAVARLGYPCILLGKIGNDVFGETLLERLREAAVDTAHVEKGSLPSGTASIAVDDAGENCIIVTPGANDQVTVPYLETKLEVLRSAGLVLAQLEIPMETVEWLAETCNKHDVPFILDPAPAQLLRPELLARVDWFTPNETEAAFFNGHSDEPEAMVRSLAGLGIRGTILKCGARGALVSTCTDEVRKVPAYSVEAVDTTAAGDAFNGAFAVALMRGLLPFESVDFATAAAAVSVTRHGAQTSMPSWEDVNRLVERSLAKFEPHESL